MDSRQKDIFSAFLDPVIGSEQGGYRPIVIISGDFMNNNSSLRIICPITSTIRNYPGSITLSPTDTNGIKNVSEILVSQVKTFNPSLIAHSAISCISFRYGLSRLIR